MEYNDSYRQRIREFRVIKGAEKMQQAIQFETIVESGMIRIPEQYIQAIPAAVIVTVAPVGEPKIKIGSKSRAGVLSITDFSALRIDTSKWSFSREEANERR